MLEALFKKSPRIIWHMHFVHASCYKVLLNHSLLLILEVRLFVNFIFCTTHLQSLFQCCLQISIWKEAYCECILHNSYAISIWMSSVESVHTKKQAHAPALPGQIRILHFVVMPSCCHMSLHISVHIPYISEVCTNLPKYSFLFRKLAQSCGSETSAKKM